VASESGSPASQIEGEGNGGMSKNARKRAAKQVSTLLLLPCKLLTKIPIGSYGGAQASTTTRRENQTTGTSRRSIRGVYSGYPLRNGSIPCSTAEAGFKG